MADARGFEVFLDKYVMRPLMDLNNVETARTTSWDQTPWHDCRTITKYLDPKYKEELKHVEKEMVKNFGLPSIAENDAPSEEEPEGDTEEQQEPSIIAAEIFWVNEPSDDSGSNYIEESSDEEDLD